MVLRLPQLVGGRRYFSLSSSSLGAKVTLLISLAIQHSLLSTTLRLCITDTSTSSIPVSSVVVIWTEIGKLVISVLIVCWNDDQELKEALEVRRQASFEQIDNTRFLLQEEDVEGEVEEERDFETSVEMFESTPTPTTTNVNNLHQRKRSSTDLFNSNHNNNRKGLSINVEKAQQGTPSLSLIPPTPAPELPLSPLRSNSSHYPREISLLFPDRPIRPTTTSNESSTSKGFERWKILRDTVFFQESDRSSIVLLAVLYALQNRAQYLAVKELEFSMFQLTSLIKIPITAICSVVLLDTTPSRLQWISLSFLTILAIKSIQLSSSSTFPDQVLVVGDSKDQVWGLTSIVFASICSGFSNCYFEKILKEKTSPQPPSDSSPPPPLSSHHQNQASSPTPSLWIRNIQLTIYGLIPNLIFLSYDFYSISLSEPSSSRVEAGVGVEGYFPLEGEVDFKDFFFPSYSPLLWLLVLIQITGGLLTGLVILRLGDLMKCFSISISMILASTFLFPL